MTFKSQIKSLIQEAELYFSQGLYAESGQKYKYALELIAMTEKIKNRDNLVTALSSKIAGINKMANLIDRGPSSPELSNRAQDLIKKLFSFSENNNSDLADLEGAIALAKFGQFDRALLEFNKLIDISSIRIASAKNIIRCHIAKTSIEDAVAQYNEWHANDLFSPKQLKTVADYLTNIIKHKNLDIILPEPTGLLQQEAPLGNQETSKSEEMSDEEDVLDITSIGITFPDGPEKGKTIEFDVNFQSGNMLSLIISSKDKSLTDGFKTGIELKNIDFFSPIAIFQGSGVIAEKTIIESGPKQGDTCIDIRITNS